ncbi:hypothetical protein I7I50_12662 [Histoplasma capsulatum G186AR]|uniref:Uncharacterized protein n=1 Tax=Ajellomyces capsulatus TaxID=5037 RepID=A0A8H7YAA8_AJECA|nr:hypothetical protein I7I52_11033 [Histoplasma capsulatum]QSS70883.1 hypothetical protein I7I50_12662 [Histoplasma capsulatum G186AR]
MLSFLSSSYISGLCSLSRGHNLVLGAGSFASLLLFAFFGPASLEAPDSGRSLALLPETRLGRQGGMRIASARNQLDSPTLANCQSHPHVLHRCQRRHPSKRAHTICQDETISDFCLFSLM